MQMKLLLFTGLSIMAALLSAIDAARADAASGTPTIYLSPRGAPLTQGRAHELAYVSQWIPICSWRSIGISRSGKGRSTDVEADSVGGVTCVRCRRWYTYKRQGKLRFITIGLFSTLTNSSIGIGRGTPSPEDMVEPKNGQDSKKVTLVETIHRRVREW